MLVENNERHRMGGQEQYVQKVRSLCWSGRVLVTGTVVRDSLGILAGLLVLIVNVLLELILALLSRQEVLQRVRPDLVLDHLTELVAAGVAVVGEPAEEALLLVVAALLAGLGSTGLGGEILTRLPLDLAGFAAR